MNPLRSEEFPAIYAGYIAHTDATDVRRVLERQRLEFHAFIMSIPEEKGMHRYQEGKWNIKEIIGHIMDTEQIMCYRALRFSRLDSTPLPGFDQDQYVRHARFNERSLERLATEFVTIRQASLLLLDQLDPEELLRTGIAAGHSCSVRALFCIISGHLAHHWDIISTRYL